MPPGRIPSYSLEAIKATVGRGRYFITRRAGTDAAALLFDEDDIKDCVLGLRERDFYKTMPSRSIEGLYQDVYRCRHRGLAIYAKLQITDAGCAVVMSFKRDERA